MSSGTTAELPAPNPGLSPADIASAMLVVFIWGSNFVVMKVGVREMGPMMLGALRFAFASLPLLLFVRKPDLPWKYIASYGLLQGLGQFGFVFLSLSLGMPAGVASIVLQMQAFFTMIMAALVLREHSRVSQWIGLGVALCGLAAIAGIVGPNTANLPLAGVGLCVAGASMWAGSNIVARLAHRHNPAFDARSLVVWGSLFPVVPFLGLAVWQSGWQASIDSIIGMTWSGVASVLYLALLATVLGYSLWAQLLKRHPASKVAPFSLLVPVVGLVFAQIFLGEQLSAVQWAGAGAIGVGLLINSFGHVFARE